jgi:hypothetical protein
MLQSLVRWQRDGQREKKKRPSLKNPTQKTKRNKNPSKTSLMCIIVAYVSQHHLPLPAY